MKDYIESKIIDPLTDLILFGDLKNLKKEKIVSVELIEGKVTLSVKD